LHSQGRIQKRFVKINSFFGLCNTKELNFWAIPLESSWIFLFHQPWISNFSNQYLFFSFFLTVLSFCAKYKHCSLSYYYIALSLLEDSLYIEHVWTAVFTVKYNGTTIRQRNLIYDSIKDVFQHHLDLKSINTAFRNC
jgi:hypothetical protein